MTFRLLFFSLALLIAPWLPPTANAQSKPVRDGNVEAQLISNQSTIAPGESFSLGLKLTIDPTWHTYWINPGETGKPTLLSLTLPDGFSAGELQFPVPKRFVTDYGFNILEAGFGYKTAVIHPITVTPPADLKPGDSITISGKADWLMCDPSSCVPGSVDLSITLQVGDSAVASADASGIELYSRKVPEAVDWPVTIALEGENLIVKATVPADAIPEGAELHLYPYETKIFDQLAEPVVTKTAAGLSFATQKHKKLTAAPESFSALIVAETGTGKTGFRISTPGGETTGTPADTAGIAAGAVAGDTAESAPGQDMGALPFGGGLLGILLAAFLGGMILNVMPCVFPVISLKVLSFVGQAGEDRKKIFAHSATFALGVLVFFWVLTAAMLIVRATGGADIGWGAQLQQPVFVIGLIFVMVVVALSLFGVFEFGASMTGVGGGLANKSGYSGSFWSGALAVLLATPCTAPLMAPAIAFALSQPGHIMILVFTSLGAGMAAPYFLFAIFPKLLDFMPAPGAWMETFKQFMGFPMLAVVAWLMGVLSKQLNVSGLQWSIGAVILLSIAAWVFGRFCGFDRSSASRTKGRIMAITIFLISLGIAYQASGQRAPFSAVAIEDVIASHQAEGKNVFVDFTAEWCVTCKVNERTTIKTEKVQQAFVDNNIEFVIADWTNEDPNITKLLKKHGRAGVPLYVLYPADPGAAPILLGDGIITSGDVDKAIGQLPK
tara:strand:- start:1562 stop:3733 length:2172 start_codon:yes stop_codon:yes gene_type:complete